MARMDGVQAHIEARFRKVQDALPVHARVARAEAMFVWARGLIERDILATSGPLSAERLRWETAMRLYGSDGASRKLIQRMLDDVSD
jgi:hypothetical protein